MNKTELIEVVASKSGASKAATGDILDALMETVMEALKKGDNVTLVGFGTFSVSERAARTGRNPRTGEALKIKASKAPKFSAGSKFKAAVDHSK